MALPAGIRSAFVVLLLLVTPSAARAGDPGPALPAGLPPAARARVQPVTAQASLATRVNGEPFVARRELFEFLLDHPEFATHVTRALKLARYRIWRTPDGLGIDDGWGTTGTFEIVWTADGLRLMHARGVYEPRLLPSIRGQAVVLIDYGVQPAADGTSRINAAVTGFVKLDSRFLTLVAGRLAGALARAKADKEARRLVTLFARTTRAIEAEPAAVYERVRRSPDVPTHDLEAFRRLLDLPATAGQ